MFVRVASPIHPGDVGDAGDQASHERVEDGVPVAGVTGDMQSNMPPKGELLKTMAAAAPPPPGADFKCGAVLRPEPASTRMSLGG